MASTCPKCHNVVEEDEICCADIRYTWRCTSCFKLTNVSIVPYGKCYLCGGKLEVIPRYEPPEASRDATVRDAMQFELNLFRFYELVRKRTTKPEQRNLLEYLDETALDHLQELEQMYGGHLDREIAIRASDEEGLRPDWPFQGIRIAADCAIEELYRVALALEERARDHFRGLGSRSPAGPESERCKELAAEEDEHIAMLQTELEELV